MCRIPSGLGGKHQTLLLTHTFVGRVYSTGLTTHHRKNCSSRNGLMMRQILLIQKMKKALELMSSDDGVFFISEHLT